jgi:hypothetical protein
MLISQQTLDTLLKSKIGYELKFCSKIPINQVSEKLSKYLNKKVSVCDESSGIDLSVNHYKLERDYADGDKVIKLITSPVPYQESRIELIKTLKFINENGFTNRDCNLYVNMYINEKTSGFNLSNFNILKFILEFNEEKIWKQFPERNNIADARSIKFIVPSDKISFDANRSLLKSDFVYPNKKFYAVDFSKIHENQIQFKYLGGKDYEKNITAVLEMQDYFIQSVIGVLKNPEMNQGNKNSLGRILQGFKKVIESYSSFKSFRNNFPNLGLLVNLDSNEHNINAFWPKIRDGIFSLLTDGGVTEGIINYDSNTGKIQLKDSDLSRSSMLNGIDIVDCKNATGFLEKCDIFNTTIHGAQINESNLFDRTSAKKCKLDNCYVNRSAVLENSFVNGSNTIMNGKMTGGIFKNGRITDMSKFENTEIIEYEKIIPGKNAKY